MQKLAITDAASDETWLRVRIGSIVKTRFRLYASVSGSYLGHKYDACGAKHQCTLLFYGFARFRHFLTRLTGRQIAAITYKHRQSSRIIDAINLEVYGSEIALLPQLPQQ